MQNLSKLFVALLATTFAFSASATPIEIVPLDDIDGLADGYSPATLGGYEMTLLDAPGTGTHSCTTAPSDDDVCFEDYWGNNATLTAAAPPWWEFPGHGNIFVVNGYNWIDIILPANTRAFSLFVGASMPGYAWIQAHDDAKNMTGREYFRVDDQNTSGYGVYATGCNALTKVTVEPWEWGFGYLSINQGECQSVPEPGTLALLGLGLLGLALTRGLQPKLQRSV